jgi:hypothetical protein
MDFQKSKVVNGQINLWLLDLSLHFCQDLDKLTSLSNKLSALQTSFAWFALTKSVAI